MKRVAIVLVAITLLGIALTACGPTENPVYTDEKQPITVGVGQQFNIVVDSNPTTGFQWTAAFDGKLLAQMGKVYAPPAQAVPGAGGKDTFTFQGVAPGTTDLTLNYARSFESVPPAQKKVFKVTVK